MNVADSATFERTVIEAARVDRSASSREPAAVAFTTPASTHDTESAQVDRSASSREPTAVAFTAPASMHETESTRVAPGNLPPQLTTFIGRSDLIAEITSAVGGARLSTLLGAGGLGKTRTALQVAVDLQPDFRDGRGRERFAQQPTQRIACPTALLLDHTAYVFSVSVAPH